MVRDFVKPSRLAKYVACRVSKDDSRLWRRDMLDAGYKTSTVNSHYTVLQCILRSVGNGDAASLPLLSDLRFARITKSGGRLPLRFTENKR